MVDNFEVEPVYEDREHERKQFKLVIDGKYYKGDYQYGEIRWLQPHPKQVITKEELANLEAEVLELLGEHGMRDETEDMEVEEMVTGNARDMQQFKLKIQGEEFKGTFHHGKIDWFHPKPKRKIKDTHIDKIEEKVQEKLDKNKG